jgi:hypothetical protein
MFVETAFQRCYKNDVFVQNLSLFWVGGGDVGLVPFLKRNCIYKSYIPINSAYFEVKTSEVVFEIELLSQKHVVSTPKPF